MLYVDYIRKNKKKFKRAWEFLNTYFFFVLMHLLKLDIFLDF